MRSLRNRSGVIAGGAHGSEDKSQTMHREPSRVVILCRAWNAGEPSLLTFDRPIEPGDTWATFHELGRTLCSTAGVLSEYTTEFTVEITLRS
jgi:hypothetical protein